MPEILSPISQFMSGCVEKSFYYRYLRQKAESSSSLNILVEAKTLYHCRIVRVQKILKHLKVQAVRGSTVVRFAVGSSEEAYVSMYCKKSIFMHC